jgi:hypothetical protein
LPKHKEVDPLGLDFLSFVNMAWATAVWRMLLKTPVDDVKGYE